MSARGKRMVTLGIPGTGLSYRTAAGTAADRILPGAGRVWSPSSASPDLIGSPSWLTAGRRRTGVSPGLVCTGGWFSANRPRAGACVKISGIEIAGMIGSTR